MEEKGTTTSAHIVGGCDYPIRVTFRTGLDTPTQELHASFPCARPPHKDGHHEVRRLDGRLLLTTEAPPVSLIDQIPVSLAPREGRDPARIDDALHVLRQVWTRWPDLRLAQLVIAAAQMGTVGKKADPFYVEDDIVVAQLRKLRDQE